GCNADSNGCTKGDACLAGACTPGDPALCITPPSGGCFVALGTCQSTGNDSYNCVYTAKRAGARCPPGADKCLQDWTCDGAGTCAGSNPTPHAADRANP